MHKSVEVAVDVAATYRLTRIVISDEVMREPREWALARIDAIRKKHPKLAYKLEYLLGCPWCVSIWASGTLLLLRRVDPALANYVSGVLAASLVTGILSDNEYRFLP